MSEQESRSPDGDGQRGRGLSAKTDPTSACLDNREAGSEPADSHPLPSRDTRLREEAACPALDAGRIVTLLEDVCRRIERDTFDGDETYRERALRKSQTLRDVYTMVENIVVDLGAAQPVPVPAAPADMDLEAGFHNRGGWFFRRDSDDGNVRIWKVRWDRQEKNGRFIQNVPILEAGPLVVPENEWASIVASVSRGGETGVSWQFVRDFHNGGCKRDGR